VCVKTGKGM